MMVEHLRISRMLIHSLEKRKELQMNNCLSSLPVRLEKQERLREFKRDESSRGINEPPIEGKFQTP